MIHGDVVARIVKKHRVRRFAEIGVWKGHTCKTILRSTGCYLDEYWAVDQWALLPERKYGRMSRVSQDKWDAMHRVCCCMMTYFPALKILRMSSVMAASIFPGEYFDMVHIDTTHFYEDTIDDIEAWLPKVKSGGILGGHDYVTGREDHQGVKLAVDEYFGERVVAHGPKSEVWTVKI